MPGSTGYSVTAPGNANRALALLRQIMNHAVAGGHIALNPTRRTKMNSRPRLTRFLSEEEIICLHEALDECVAEQPDRVRQADIIRLLLYHREHEKARSRTCGGPRSTETRSGSSTARPGRERCT